MRTDDDPHPRDEYEADENDSTSSLSPYKWAAWSAWGLEWPYRSADDDESVGEETHTEADERWLDEGVFSLLVIVGVVLVVVPEPSTSVLGGFLLLIGGIGWIVDAIS